MAFSVDATKGPHLAIGIGIVLVLAWLLFRGADGRTTAERVERTAISVASAMRALEDDLVDHLLAEGDAADNVSRRVTGAQTRFPWARTLTIVVPDGAVGVPDDGRALGWPAATHERRIRNLLQRAALERPQANDADRASDQRAATLRFPSSNPRAGIIVLVNLRRDRLWAAYRVRPGLLERLLAAQQSRGRSLAWIEPGGRIHASEPWTTGSFTTAAVDTAPGWQVAAASEEPARDDRRVWLGVGLGALLLVSVPALLLLRRRDAPVGATSQSTDELNAGAEPRSDAPSATVGDRFAIGDATVDLGRYVVVRGAEEHPLTNREVELLRLLVASPNRVLRRDHLLDTVWGYASDVTTRTVDTFMYRLRQKIEADPAAPRHLVTVRGAGYRFVP